MMWNTQLKEIEKNRIVQFKILENNKELTIDTVINYWISNSEFRAFYNSILSTSSFESYFWEHPAITKRDLQNSYEFVLVNSKILSQVKPNIKAFQAYFKEDKKVVVFSNLGGDAKLIVPTPMNKIEIYPHLSKFVRNAEKDQLDDFWIELGITYKESIGSAKKWLSTAGLGVSWLHARIDIRPKYYKYHSYK